jgi:membrane protein DedA with SNARE-associated domain/membrane-associated phospholipid phosphatase
MQWVDYISDLATRLGQWGYLVVFAVVALECQAMLGLLMPGESLVLITGFLAGQGVFDLDALIVTVSAAAIVGDSVGYEIGRYLGRRWLQRYCAWFGIRDRHLVTVDRYFERHGGKSVFFSHFMHLLRALTPFMAGASRMPYGRFVLYNAIGCILWASLFSLLGYFFGRSWHVLEQWIGRAAALLGAALLLVIAGAWLRQWIVRHEKELRGQWQTLIHQPTIARFRRGFAPQIRFLQQRLTPGGYLGLRLTVGAGIIVLASWTFGSIVEDVLTQDPLVILDKRVALWIHAHATPEATQAAKVITFFGSPAFLTGASVLCAGILLAQRARSRLLALVLTMAGGSVLNLLLKGIFQRPRPGLEKTLVNASSYGFPSGHVMGATLFYLFLAATFASATSVWRWRVSAIVTALVFILLVGFSRIYLQAHYLSDVLGAMAAGVAWLALCLTAVDTVRRYHEHSNFSR